MSLDPLSDAAFAAAYDALQRPEDGDRSLRVRFYYEEIEDPEATRQAGRPIFKSVEMCEIRHGDRMNPINDRVKTMRPDPRIRFPEQYRRFKAGEARQVKGQPITEWGLITRAEAKTYATAGIETVEELAGLTDQGARDLKLPGIISNRQKARDFLAVAQKLEPAAQARAEADKLRAELEALRETVEALKAQRTAPVADDEPQQTIPQATPPTIRRKAV